MFIQPQQLYFSCTYLHHKDYNTTEKTSFASLKPWPNRLASNGTSRRKFSKPELVYGLAKGGQKDSQVGSQVAKSRKFHAYHWLMRFYNNRLLVINLCRLALGGQMVKKLASTCVQI